MKNQGSKLVKSINNHLQEVKKAQEAVKLGPLEVEEHPARKGEFSVWTKDGLRIAALIRSRKNAELLASAPELLEALKDLSQWVKMNTGVMPAELIKAITAINKAEGRVE